MSLDSVELLMSFEDYFQISVPDVDAEKVVTIQEMADLVVRYKGIEPKDSQLKQTVQGRVVAAMQELQLIEAPIKGSDKVFQTRWPEKEGLWQRFLECLQLEAPEPEVKDPPKSRVGKWFRTNIWRITYEWEGITLDQFVIAICAANYKKLMDAVALRDPFEVYCAVVAITVEKTGVDYYEVEPWKSFANDLGID